MSLTDTFVRKVNSIKKTGDKYTDVDGMYLLVTPTGKYWRLDYRHLGKRKTLVGPLRFENSPISDCCRDLRDRVIFYAYFSNAR